jgi:hypothetical protein
MLAPLTNDPVYTVDEVAAMLKVSRWTVIRIFADEPGVVDIGSPVTTKRARRYRVLRIPVSVINRVLARRRK